jgi:uncharacterized protein (TIGR03000 family)
MYSIVLMAAATALPASTGWHWQSCSGYSCTGCQGCYGCSGCSGWGYSHYAGNLCSGCSGCYGYGCYGNGSGFTIYAPAVTCAGMPFGCTGCYGCYGGWSCYGVPLPGHGYWHECPPGVVQPKGPDGQKSEETPLPKELKKTSRETRARIVFDLPEGSTLSVDGRPIKMNPGLRVFETPDLVPGEKYFYDVRVEAERNGQKLVRNQRVIVNPGQTVTVAFPDLYTEAARN